MTSLTIDGFDASGGNPLDILEMIIAQNEWPYERAGDEEITVAVSGDWCDFHIRYFWLSEENMLQAAGMLDMRVPNSKKAAVQETLSLVNERLVMGHFGIWSEDSTIMFRNTQLLSHNMEDVAHLCEQVTQVILGECNRYYPVFQFVLWAGKGPREALEAAMLETVGQA
ncbi:YbjN domain-containing protein [Luteithermobacter gelatinilyticus]|uniref:YbjN domain-containing protein n=1 Tax=Luteithermobacter gelatinilyticus TaxID=2582913 RepID=UPI0011069545|nr:YbjN domain-containing protein [Luteithermobacter gelatinilyticus]|tara:strand:- start:22065 stop:22571 length:507 start_codon:yes stop_codon:yes gene_type:complete